MEYQVLKPKEGSEEEMIKFILEMDILFIPNLSSRVDIKEWCERLYNNATRFIYRDDEKIVAMSIAYINKKPRESFGTYLAVDPSYEKDGLGLDLTLRAINYAKEYGSASFRIKIRTSNKMLCKFYKLQGFEITKEETYPNSRIKEFEMVKMFK